MKLKYCSSCKKQLTTKTVKSLGSKMWDESTKALFYNCKACDTTQVIFKKVG